MVVRAAEAVDDARGRIGAHAAAAGGMVLIVQAADVAHPAVVGLRQLREEILEVLARRGRARVGRRVDLVLDAPASDRPSGSSSPDRA